MAQPPTQRRSRATGKAGPLDEPGVRRTPAEPPKSMLPEAKPVPVGADGETGDPRLKQREPTTRKLVTARSPAQDIPVLSSSDFNSVPAVRQALSELEANGQFDASARLVDQLLGDDSITGVLTTRVQGLLGLPMTVAPEKGREEGPVEEELRARFDSMLPPEELVRLCVNAIMLGAGVGQLVWAPGPTGKLEPRLKAWDMRHVYWRWDTRSYWVSTANQSTVEVVPGDGQWVLLTPLGAQRGWMWGRVRALAVPWLIRVWARRDWARHSETLGMPARKAIVPATASAEDKDGFLRDIASLASESAILLEQDTVEGGPRYDLELLEAGASHGDNFNALLASADQAIAIAIVGQNLTTKVEGGSFAAASVHDKVRGDILRFDGKALAACLNDQVLRPWVAVNFGAAPAPTVSWNTDPPENEGERATTLQRVAAATSELAQAGYKVDRKALAERFRIPLEESAKDEDTEDGNARVYGYHLQAGVITVNEVRRTLGFPPLPSPVGDQLVGAAPPAPPEQGKPKQAQASRLALSLSGMEQGQLYADAVADAAKAEAAEAMRPELDAILKVVRTAKSYTDMRAALLSMYRKLDAAALSRVIERALVLAKLDGRLSVLEDL